MLYAGHIHHTVRTGFVRLFALDTHFARPLSACRPGLGVPGTQYQNGPCGHPVCWWRGNRKVGPLLVPYWTIAGYGTRLRKRRRQSRSSPSDRYGGLALPISSGCDFLGSMAFTAWWCKSNRRKDPSIHRADHVQSVGWGQARAEQPTRGVAESS